MVVILYQDGGQEVAEKTTLDLLGAFADHVAITQIAPNPEAALPSEISWDDLFIVLYTSDEFPVFSDKRKLAAWRPKQTQGVLVESL